MLTQGLANFTKSGLKHSQVDKRFLNQNSIKKGRLERPFSLNNL
jgi:hypothetical protein